MNKVREARFLNPDRSRNFEAEAHPADRHFNYDEREIPGGSFYQIEEVAIRLP